MKTWNYIAKYRNTASGMGALEMRIAPATDGMLIGFTSRSPDGWRYLKHKSVFFLVDGRPMALGDGRWDGDVIKGSSVSETLVIAGPRQLADAIALATTVEVRVGPDEFQISPGGLAALRGFLAQGAGARGRGSDSDKLPGDPPKEKPAQRLPDNAEAAKEGAVADGADGGRCYGNKTCDDGFLCDETTNQCTADSVEVPPIGVAECDALIVNYTACIADQDQEFRGQAMKAFLSSVALWRKAAASADEVGLSNLAKGCAQSSAPLQEAMAELGCTWNR